MDCTPGKNEFTKGDTRKMVSVGSCSPSLPLPSASPAPPPSCPGFGPSPRFPRVPSGPPPPSLCLLPACLAACLPLAGCLFGWLLLSAALLARVVCGTGLGIGLAFHALELFFAFHFFKTSNSCRAGYSSGCRIWPRGGRTEVDLFHHSP